MLRLVPVFFIIHGLISGALSVGHFIPGPGVPNPAWLSWWPVNLGQSWLLTPLRWETRPVLTMGGALWVLAGICFLGAALSLLGVLPAGAWRPLAGGAAVVSLVMLALYFHPWYILGTLLNLAVLAGAYWQSPAVR